MRSVGLLWEEALISSRLLAFETWTRVHARDLSPSHGEAARELVSRVSLLELSPDVLERALEPFPIPVRTLDALHLASVVFLHERRVDVRLAAYDGRMLRAAGELGIPLFEGD